MGSVILCEGRTDCIFLQYYMRKVHGWNDYGSGKFRVEQFFSRTLRRGTDKLTIAAMGGCSRIALSLEQVIEFDKIQRANQEDHFEHIVVLADNDEVGTIESLEQRVYDVLVANTESIDGDIENNKWCKVKYTNKTGEDVEVSVLLLVIPFEENGALETFLLNAISRQDPYDAQMIYSCNQAS